ncbi:MAG: branched-chain amino acid ABC transporter permease [Myxococcales bacterium]
MSARRKTAFAAALALLVGVPPFLPPYPLTLVTQILIFAVFAMSLDLLLGYTGLASLGHAAYFGVAAYVVAILVTRNQASFWTCLGAAILAATTVAAVFGLVAIRATGVYFLMITLALGMVVWGLAFRWVSLTMGDNGISGIPRPSLGGISLAAPLAFHYLSLAVFLVAFALLSVVVRSPFGLSLQGIRETERRMRALGYDVWLHKYLAFVLAGAFAGLAGALWAYYDGFVSPVEVHLITSVETLLMVALGGPGTLLGPILGAAVIVLFKNLLSIYTKRWLLILGLVYIGVIVLTPRGILGAVRGAQK